MRVLNLYSSIGGNRKLWEDVEVTAVEMEHARAEFYQEQFPNDTVIVGDAHKYLLDNYKEFDFIRASPPCPTHSRMLLSNETRFYEKNNMKYPDMKLYQEIILLRQYCPSHIKRCIENAECYILKKDYTDEELFDFLNSIDYTYNDGYGGQKLYGLVRLEDGRLERGEYDGAEWREHKKRPSIPKECMGS